MIVVFVFRILPTLRALDVRRDPIGKDADLGSPVDLCAAWRRSLLHNQDQVSPLPVLVRNPDPVVK